MNKVITTQGNVQFIFPDGKIVNVHPNHIYTVYNEDTVSFILVGLPKTSGLSTMTSKAEDLELNGTVYSFAELPNAVSEAFAIAGAQARCEIVDELPETGYTNTIYLVPQPAPQTGFDEYVYILDQGWELIGDTSIEMDNYVLKTVFSGYTADTAVVLNGLRTDVDTTSGNVITETERALLAESGLSDSIDAEEAAREAADGVISGAVDTVSSGLTEEAERAQNAESDLSDAIDVVSGALDTHIQDEVRHISGAEKTSWNEKTKTISLTQAEYDALPSSAKTDATKLYVISDAQPIDLSVYAKVSALTEEISARTDADTALDNKINAVSGATDDALALKLDASAYTVDSSVIENSVNPVQGGALWDELRIGGEPSETTLEWDNYNDSTNYPSGCTEIKLEFTSEGSGSIVFLDENYEGLGSVDVVYQPQQSMVIVDNTDFEDSSYEISGSTITISYPSVTNVAKVYCRIHNYATVKAIYNDPLIVLKDQVTANTTSLVGKVNISDFEVYSAATDSRLSEDEEVTAAAFNELNEALSGKQDTLSAERGISISSNTISFDLPIYAGTGSDSIVEGYSLNVANELSHAEGYNTKAAGWASHAEGWGTVASGGTSHTEGGYTKANGNASHAEGYYTYAIGDYSHAEGIETYAIGNYSHVEGRNTATKNEAEHASGQFNNSVSASTTFGDGGNTLFSVGNGADDNTRHNAFEIRQNGDIYFEYDGNDIKLQDKLDDIESVTAAAINNLNDKFGGLKLQQITQSAYDQLQTKDPSTLYVIVG